MTEHLQLDPPIEISRGCQDISVLERNVHTLETNEICDGVTKSIQFCSVLHGKISETWESTIRIWNRITDYV